MSKDLEGLLANLLKEFTTTGLLSIDQIADVLSDQAIYVEELEEDDRALVDRFLQDAFALWRTREQL